jgi:hypothetical protein
VKQFESIKKEVFGLLPQSPITFEVKHAELVLEWLLKLKPDADECFQIAAFSHDIDRAITKITEKDCKDYSQIDEFKKAHALRSAGFIGEIMQKHGCTAQGIAKVKHLVENHEVGGDPDTDTLMTADSLAYFEYNIPGYQKRYGRDATKKKIRFMYDRLSPEAQQMVEQMKFSEPTVGELVRETIGDPSTEK